MPNCRSSPAECTCVWAVMTRSTSVVPVRGCPMTQIEFLKVFTSLVMGKTPEEPDHAVCVECKLKENECVYERGMICLGPKKVLGVFGEIHPKILGAMDVKGPAMGFTLWPAEIPEPRSTSTTRPALDISDLQAVERAAGREGVRLRHAVGPSPFGPVVEDRAHPLDPPFVFHARILRPCTAPVAPGRRRGVRCGARWRSP